MSCFDVRLAVLASPDRARSLFTVRAAISSARLVLSPRCSALSLTCSYCRSRFGLDPLGMSATFRHRRSLDRAHTRRGWGVYPGRPGPFSCPVKSDRASHVRTEYDAVRYDSAPLAGLPARRLAVVIDTRYILVGQCPGAPRLGLEPGPGPGLGLMG